MKDARLRFMKHVEQDGDCWNWQSELNNRGYGFFYIAERRLLAHRYSYELFNGPIPHGLEIDHLCRNRRCVNPDHLETVTTKVNVLRGISFAAVNAKKTHCPKGHSYEFFDGTSRRCKPCHSEKMRRYNRKRTEQAKERASA